VRWKDCSQVRGHPYKRSHLVALRRTKISASHPPSTWWRGAASYLEQSGGATMTSRNEVIPWGVAIAGDVMSKLMIPGGNSLSKLGDAYLQKKRKEAADILIEEIAKGSPEPIAFTESDADPLIEIIYRFSKAVADGAARENLLISH
jgi:hypothetical protein